MKRPIYSICHLCFFNQVRMAYFLRYGRFYEPHKNTMIRLSTACDTTVEAIVLWMIRLSTKCVNYLSCTGVKIHDLFYGYNWNMLFKTVFTSNIEEKYMFYADLYLKGAIFTNNNSTPFHLSHIFKLTQQTTKLVTEGNSQVWIEYKRKL